MGASGWCIQWLDIGGFSNSLIHIGLVSAFDFDFVPNVYITSTETSQSQMWSGVSGPFQWGKVTKFANDAQFITVTVTATCISNTPIFDFYCTLRHSNQPC